MPSLNECGECGHDLDPSEGKKGHVKRGDAVICSECLNVCNQPTTKAPPVGIPQSNPIQSTPQDVERVAQLLAEKMKAIQNQQLWHDLQSPGTVIQAVDGGFIIISRFGPTAVRVSVDEALAKAREYLVPP